MFVNREFIHVNLLKSKTSKTSEVVPQPRLQMIAKLQNLVNKTNKALKSGLRFHD